MPDTNEEINREEYLELRLRYAERLNQILFKIVRAIDAKDPVKFREDADLTPGENAKLNIFMSDEYLARSYDG